MDELARRAHRHRRRMARAHGQQARRPGAAGDRPAAALESAARGLGTVGDARQPERGDAGAARPRRRRDGARPAREEPRHRHACCRSTPGASPGAATSASRCSSRWSRRSRRRATTLVFVNMRSQAEAWYQLILELRPEWAGLVALHHGSLDKEVRDWVELGLKEGRLKAVVATSSLDLGVDFLPVERVLQIGSAKGVARLLQRAGRSGHAPGRASRITLVPTNTLELVEATAARRAALAGRIEKRATPDKPFDVLVQHLVTVALGGGFRDDELFEEVQARLGLPQADPGRIPVGARLRRQGRRQPARLSRVPPRRRRRRRRVPGAEPGDRAPPQAQRRHHRQRRVHAGEVPERRAHRHGRGGLRRAPEEGRLLRLRRPHPRVRARRGDDGLRQARRSARRRR